MQIPPQLPQIDVPVNRAKTEPVVRVMPVVFSDVAAKFMDPSVILKVPVPVGQVPNQAQPVKPSTQHPGQLHVSPEQVADDPELAHALKLAAQLGRAESGPHTLKWPQPVMTNGQPLPQGQAVAQNPQQALVALRDALASSSMLAVSQLAHKLAPDVLKETAAPGRAVSNKSTNGRPESLLDKLRASDADLAHETSLQDLSQQLPTNGSQQLQDGLNLLLHGQLLWAGELLPGVQARIFREDAYAEDPDTPGGQLVKGSQISLEATLPTLGQVTIRGLQVKDSVGLLVLPEKKAQGVLKNNLAELDSRLEKAGLNEVRVRLAVDE
jgi:hypothetical protein